MPDSALGDYYDRLARWTSVVRAIGHDGGRGTLTVHRRLADPAANGRLTTTRVHDVLAEMLPDLRHPRILDAGCGLGGTLLDLVPRLGGRGIGLTLSDSQAAVARDAVRRAGLTDRIDVRAASYDTPPSGPFDLVVAVESLAHSPDPARSVAALAGVLAPRGVLAIVDDMPEPGADATGDLAAFRQGWRCPVVWSEREFLDAFERLGLVARDVRDLTNDVRPRGATAIATLDALNRFARRLPFDGWRTVMDSHHGGLALERLYRAGLMRYRVLTAARR
ncbi:MAG: methyltransferase domain-containing protein [Vicinamibacterales bacterium]